MNPTNHVLRFALHLSRFTFCVLLAVCSAARAQTTNNHAIDLPTALRLAGAQSLDVGIARQRLLEAKANHAGALAQFFPWVAPGITYRQHDDNIQDVEGNIVDVHKYSYAPGASLTAYVDIGEALYKTLAAKQLIQAAGHALEAQRQDSVAAAAQAFFDLAFAQAAIGVAQESALISRQYDEQLQQAVRSGLAFKGDQLRASVQAERSQLSLRLAGEQRRLASARLSQVLRLDPAVELWPQDPGLLPLRLFETNAALAPLVQRALADRPELKQSHALAAAALDAKRGAAYAPWIPSVGGQAFFGGLGGGRQGIADTFGAQEDYVVGLSWRVGPGGLFDFTRSDAADARLKVAELTRQKMEEEITRQVVEAFTHYQSLNDQIGIAQRVLAAAEAGLRLTQQRKEFAVGVVLENILSEQDLTRARLDYLKVIMDFNKAQYALNKTIGNF